MDYEHTSAEVDKALRIGSVVCCGVLEKMNWEKLNKMNIEKYKKELESGIYEGVQDGTFYIGGKVVVKVLRDAVNEALAISRVRLSLPDSEEITDAAMEYAEIDGTTDEYDESVRDAAHFVAGATWYHKRIKGNEA